MQTEGFIILTVRFEREGDQWAATCLELGTAACGDNFEEAQEAIREAITLQLNALEELGERASFFQRYRIRFYRQAPRVHQRATSSPVWPGEIVERLVERVPAMAI